MKTRFIYLLAVLIGFTACSEDDITVIEPIVMEYPDLSAGSADFSTYVSIGNSLTAGYTDAALFTASQENSLPSILATQFAAVGGGAFVQPLTSDNFGGLVAAGTRIADPRLVFGGAGPVGLETIIGGITPATDIVLNNPTGPFNNMGVPGAKSFHLLFDGYGNLGNLELGLANPYYIRMASSPTATVLGDVMAQSPSFFTLWIGNNDVLGYATTGGDGTNSITPVDGPPGVGFNQTYGYIAETLTSGGAKGVVANIPYVTSIPHFTTVPHNPLSPLDENFGPQIPKLNGIFGSLNQIFSAYGETNRIIEFSTTAASAVVIKDETLADFSAQISGALMASPTFPAFLAQFGLPEAAGPLVAGLLGQTYGQARQATEGDLLVLPSSTVIGTVNVANVGALMAGGLSQAIAGQFSVEGISLPLEDKWVLIPSEQVEIKEAIDAFNTTIAATAASKGLALVDANDLMQQLADGGFTDGDFVLTSNLVTGGAFSLDGVHPTSRGYALLANEFMKQIDATYGSNFKEAGKYVNIGNYPTNYSPALQ